MKDRGGAYGGGGGVKGATRDDNCIDNGHSLWDNGIRWRRAAEEMKCLEARVR